MLANVASRRALVSLAALALMTAPALSAELTEEAINGAGMDAADGQSPTMVKLQILLDRAHVSPGVIDGYEGDNVSKALAAYEEMNGLEADGALDQEVWAMLTESGAPVVEAYTITEEDVSRDFVNPTPDDYAELAELESVPYQTPLEMLGERFHMDQDLLTAMNPDADFGSAGQTILVAAPGGKAETEVARIVANKSRRALEIYNEAGDMVLFYPATIGSDETPSPTGTHEVRAVAPEAAYYYNPSVNFQQGDNSEPLEIPAGPNNPVGGVWIDLTEDTYGIHGTSDPASISKTASHGCVRLTNWDARELADLLIGGGVPVEFTE